MVILKSGVYFCSLHPNWQRLIRALTGNKSDLHGSASYMSWLEQQFFLSRSNEGLVIGEGRLSLKSSCANLLAVAPPGKGKSTKVIIKNLLQLDKKASAVVTDSSGEIFNTTSGELGKTHLIQVLNPQNLTQSDYCNPCLYYNTNEERDTLAQLIGHHNADPNGKDRFWTANASNLIYLALSALNRQAKEEDQTCYTLPALRSLLVQLNRATDAHSSVNLFLQRYLNPSQFADYLSFLKYREDLRRDILTTALTTLSMCKEPEADISLLCAHNSFDLRCLRQKPSVIYLQIPEEEIERLSLFITLFYRTVFKVLKEKAPQPSLRPVYLFLDEFGNAGRIMNFATFANTLRKYQVSITIILQSLSQLNRCYGSDEAKAIREAMNNKLFLPGIQDAETLRLIELLLGIKTETETAKDGQQEKKVAKPLKRAHEVRLLHNDEAIFISENHPPVLLKCQGYYQNRTLRQKAAQKPYPLPVQKSVPKPLTNYEFSSPEAVFNIHLFIKAVAIPLNRFYLTELSQQGRLAMTYCLR